MADDKANTASDVKVGAITPPPSSVGAGKPGEGKDASPGAGLKTSQASGRTVTTAADRDEDIPPNAPIEDAPIGNIEDALKSHVPTIDAPKEDANTKERDEDSEQPIESLAALRDYHNARGTAPSTEQVDKVRELEQKIAVEGGKKHRTNDIQKGK